MQENKWKSRKSVAISKNNGSTLESRVLIKENITSNLIILSVRSRINSITMMKETRVQTKGIWSRISLLIPSFPDGFQVMKMEEIIIFQNLNKKKRKNTETLFLIKWSVL